MPSPTSRGSVAQMKTCRNMIQIWARTEESCGAEALRHKNQNKVWTAEEKYGLVAKVLAGESNRTTAIAAEIKSYYVEGGFSHLIHMTAAHLW